MDIKIKNRTAHDLDEVLTEDDKLIFRCPQCQLLYLPREAQGTVMRWRKPDGYVGSALALGCADPKCYYQGEPIILTREEYELTRRYERAGLVPCEHGITGLVPN